MRNTTARIAIGIVGAGALALAGCSDDGKDAGDVASNATSAAAEAGASATSAAGEAGEAADSAAADAAEGDLELADGYCKATGNGSMMEGMTGCFGVLRNHTDADIHVKEITADDLDGARIEMHEVVGGEMRQIDGGFVVPAGGELTMEPGGYHIMLMDLSEDLDAGQEVEVELHTDAEGDDSDFEFTLPVREQASGEEDYGDGEGYSEESEGHMGHMHHEGEDAMNHTEEDDD